jgi:hypothetical protein
MPRTTPERWLAFAAVTIAGLCVAFVVDLLVRRPGIVIPMLVAAYLITRATAPLSYTINLIEHYRGSPIAQDFANFVLPLAVIGALAVGTWQNRDHGIAIAFMATFIELYIVDRVVAFVIDQVAGYVRYRRGRRQEQDETWQRFCQQTPDGEPVDAVVVDADLVDGEANR